MATTPNALTPGKLLFLATVLADSLLVRLSEQFPSANIADVQAGLFATPDEASWILTVYTMASFAGIVTSVLCIKALSIGRYVVVSSIFFAITAAAAGTAPDLGVDDSGMESTARDLVQRPFTPAGNARAAPPGHCQTRGARRWPAGRTLDLGRLCLPAGSDHRRVPTVHLAVHGATHSRLYWAWPHRPKTHSYVDHLVAGGYAVFAFDRIGVGGAPTRPASGDHGGQCLRAPPTGACAAERGDREDRTPAGRAGGQWVGIDYRGRAPTRMWAPWC